MNVIVESLGDPIWQIGGGIIMLATLVLILALRSPEVHLAPRHQWLWTRLTLLVCLSLFLALSGGVVWFHGANAAYAVGPAVTQPSSATASSHGGFLPSPTPLPSPSPSPTRIPRLVPSPAQVLTTFCDAIDRHDLNTAWEQYAKALQKERTGLPPPSTRLTIVHCRVDQVSDMSATGFLMLQTVGPYGYTDGYEREFQLDLKVVDGALKSGEIDRCIMAGLCDTIMSGL